MMKIVFKPSPSVTHKYRVVFPDRRAIDFGVKGGHDYTTHGNPMLVRDHILDHGGIIPMHSLVETDPHKVHRAMLEVDKSTKEDWTDVYSKDYWERWLLWTYPNVEHAKLFLTMRQNHLFMPHEDTFY